MADRKAAGRFLLEGLVIVASILLAFGIEAGWSEWQERDDERESLRLVDRDLAIAIEWLAEFEEIATAGVDAGGRIVAAMSGPDPVDPDRMRRDFIVVTLRRTLRIPTAAYTDLVSTGNLRIIEDRLLRDRLIAFYEGATRSLEIVASNNRVHIDGMIDGAAVREGLFMPVTGVADDVLVPLVVAAESLVEDALGEDFAFPPDRIWTLPPTSREWAVLRNATLWAQRSHGVHVQLVRSLSEEAASLREDIAAYLVD